MLEGSPPVAVPKVHVFVPQHPVESDCWKPESFKLLDQTVDEMLALEMCLPMCLFNLRAGIDDLVTASDACESGGGTCYSNRLSHAGVKEAKD